MKLTFKASAVAVAVVLTAGFGATACSSSGSGSGDGIVTANGSEPQKGLVPTNINENGGGRIADRLWSGLKYYDADGKDRNEVAQSIDSPDRQHYTIKIKPDWKFTDGTPVTAKSFVDAWNYGALATNGQLQSWVFEPIAGYDDVQASPPKAKAMSGLKVVDDTTFTVDLKRANIDFEASLAFTPFYPLPEVAYKDMKAYGENPIGDGPYKLASQGAWQHNVKIGLLRNDDYKGGRPAKNKGIDFIFYQSMDTAYADLQAGNLDVLDTVPDSALGTYKQDLGDRAITKPTAQNQHIGIQGHVAHFTGEEGVLRREALSLAINREQISQNIFHGSRIVAKDFTASTLPGYNDHLDGIDFLKYNPDQAKKLWAQANAIAPWTGKFQIAYNSDGGHQAWIDATANSIKNTLGIDAEGAPYPTFKAIRDQVTGHKLDQAFRYGWQGDYPTMLEFLTPQYTSDSPTNDVEYKNPAFDDLIHKAQAASTLDESHQFVAQAQTLLLKDMADIPLFYYVANGGVSDKVHNAKMAWSGLFDFENIEK